MANNIVGSVAAEITLDTEQFENAIKKLKGDVEDIKDTFNKKTGGKNGLVDEVKQLKEEIDSLKGKINDYKTSIKTLREENSKYVKEIEKLNKQLDASKKSHADNVKLVKKEQSVLESAAKSAEKYALKTEKIGKRNTYKKSSASDFKSGTWTVNPELQDQVKLETLKNAYFQYDRIVRESAQKEKMYWQTRQSNMRNAMETYVNGVRNLVTAQKQAMVSLNSNSGMNNFINTASNAKRALNEINNINFTKLSDNVYRNGELVRSMGESWRKTQSDIVESTTLIKTTYKQVGDEIEVIRTKIGRVSEVLSTFNFKLIELADSENIAARRAIELSSAIQRINVQGTANWSGRQTTGGYSNYISQSGQIANTLKRQAQSAKEAKYAVEGLSQAYSKINLNSYKANINQVNRALDQQRLRTAQLEAAQSSLYYKNAPNNLNTYKMNMDQINQSLERQTGTYQKNNNEIKRGQRSMREFGTTMGKAEAYSNNLYRGLQKVRSVIVSFKTIMGAMGGMAVWSFASDLVEGAKESYKAKSEMESLLQKNKKVNANGIITFNKALDDTIGKFQKINKYSLGETAASIGLEFNLSAKEMAKSLNSIAMIQNEYARAGRSNEEAALAVKDILQGEFRRLSMETGIGEEELTEKYGWNGKKEDVMDLMKALEKAGEDRHWDLFAEKATSVGDIVNITKSRFSEFGADLITNAEPMIVGAFNGMLDVINSLTGAFEGMGSFGKIFTIGATGATAFTGISTALMMFKRNMGLAEIATLGWGRSFGTALMGLNKTEVALHGFWKTLLATVSGTDAATVANTGFGKSLVARLLGVKANIAGEEGLLKAIMVSQGALRGESEIMTLTASSGLTLSQRLAAVTNNLSATEVKGWGLRKSLMSVVTSTKLLKIALLGLTSVAILAWFAGVAAEADRVKKIMEGSNKVASEGKDIAKDAQENVDKLTDKLTGLTEGTKKYKKVQKQLKIAKWNKEDIDSANELVKSYKKLNKERKEGINERAKDRLNDSYKLAGLDDQAAAKATTGYEAQVKAAQEIRNKSLTEYDNRLYRASQHMNEHVELMKKSGAKQEDMVKYITEYNAESRNTAKLWKKFNEGDLQSGFYAMMSELKLIWIDLWNNEHFVNFWNAVNKTWKDLKPTVYAIKDGLIGIGEALMDFFSTDSGRWIGTIGLLGTGIGAIGLKIGKWVTGSKSVFEVLKKVGGKLKDVAKGWKDVKDNAEDAIEKTGGSTSTGGINGDVNTTTPSKTPFKETLKGDAQRYARAAIGIAAGMALITEAIYLLKAPMWALAEVGKDFKAQEPQIREGIEGLQVVAPTITAILIPVLALTKVMDKYVDITQPQFWKTIGASAVGIAVGLGLVAETILMIIPSIWALGTLGDQYSGMETQVKKGTKAMKVVSDSLKYLLPFVPALAGGILLGIAIFESGPVGLALTGAAALGIAVGMGLVTEAIWTLQAPLWAIGDLGSKFSDLSNVQQGAEAMKLTAEALGYVNDAMTSLTGIDLNLLAQNITQIVSEWLGVDLGASLSSLADEGGVLDQLSSFVQKFNSDEFVIEQINQDKVTALGLAGDGIGTIGDAMAKINTAMQNLPPEFKNNTGDQLGITGNNTNGTAAQTQSVDVNGYFDSFKEPLKQLKTFIHDFNTSDDYNFEPIDPTRVENLSKAADVVETVNGVVEKVKTTMQNVGQSGHDAAFAEGGAIMAFGYDLFHMTGLDSVNNGQSSGNYKSSLGSQLQEMEDIVSDLFTFQSNISQYGGGEGGEGVNTEGVASLVTRVQEAISSLSQILSDAVPSFTDKGKNISSAIVNGVNDGLTGLGDGISDKVASAIDAAKPTAKTYGKGLGWNVQDGFQTNLKIESTLTTEVDNALNAIGDGKAQEFYDKGKALGDSFATGFKDGSGIHSPGYAAQAMSSEIGYISQYLNDGVINLPSLAGQLGSAISSNFNPSFDLSNIQLPDVSTWASNLSTIPTTVGNVKTQVATNFEGMKTSVQSSFTNIVSKTRTSLLNMKGATVKNIGNIRTSWKGMQDALIASADHIKTQTGSKIDKLKSNLGDFWNKIKHPDQLLQGFQGGHRGSIKRRSVPKGNYAGPAFNFKPKRSRGQPSDNSMEEYLKCLLETGQPCYAGGWNFNWTKSIKRKFKGWNTHFGQFHLDDYLNVGKFENNKFPVKGNAEVAKAYIFDTIRATSYDKYFNSNFGDNPVAALLAGAFNCWDGTNIVLALAEAFGFSGSREHGTWNGIGHVWANIPGLGIIDPTAIQQNGSFKSSSVRGYSAGSIRRGKKGDVPPTGNTTHNNEVHIHIEGPVYGVDDLHKEIEKGAKKVARGLFKNSYSGV